MGGNPITGLLSLGAFGIFIWGFVCAARIIFSAVSSVLDVISTGWIGDIANNIVLSAIGGALAGLAGVAMRSWPKKPGHTTQSFISALFHKGLADPQLEEAFWFKTLLGGIIGAIVGGISGGGGTVNFPQFFSGSTATIIHNRGLAVIGFAGGGFGGPEGGGILSLLFLIVVVLIVAVVVALVAGFVIHLLLYGVAGATKGATKAYILQILKDKGPSDNHPIMDGLKRGFIVGMIVGVLQAGFTATGIIRFYQP
jgi:ABC-type multidrug transport system fused ATPase/permease subunit